MSHILTTPAESLEIAIPSFACRLMDMIGAEVGDMDSGSVTNGSAEALICQNLTDLSLDAEMREEENVREVMELVCPIKVLMGYGFRLVMSQTQMVQSEAPATNLPSGERQQHFKSLLVAC
jgi:hypothetical protein